MTLKMLAMVTLVSIVAGALAPPQLLSVDIRDSLEASIVRVESTFGPALSAEIARLLRWRGDVNRAIHKHDTVHIIWQPGSTEPDLLAMRFDGEELSLRAYKFVGRDGIARYYDERGDLIEPVLLNPPVSNYVQITETVQHSRGKRKHNGLDLKAPEGTPIHVPYGASVRRVNWFRRVNGNCVEVAYDNGKIARFLHLSQIEAQVRPGAYLEAGARLGAVGTTGHSNAAHLHYEIWSNGVVQEPMQAHGTRKGHLDGASMPSFASERDAFDRALLGPMVSPPAQLSVLSCIPFSDDAQKPLGCKP